MDIRSHPIFYRFFLLIIAPSGLGILAVFLFFRQGLPLLDGIVYVDGLSAQVSITRDAFGVPHIRATNDNDAFFAIGYAHAQDRLWQMEYQRRLGQGRLSEVFDRRKLESDQFMRTLGIYRASQQALQSLSQAARASLEAYCRGVNAWLEEGHVLPIEFYFLGYKPEAWEMEDSILQIKLLALSLGLNYQKELIFSLLVNELGFEKAEEITPGYPSGGTLVTDSFTERDRGQSQVGYSTDISLASQMVSFQEGWSQSTGIGQEGVGSNGWAVSGSLTSTGKPLLANDPHLGTQMPALWYLAELEGDVLHVTGATLPGVPFVILGHNDTIAWGGTNLGADVQDLYIERINPTDENLYDRDGEWVPVTVNEEWIAVKPSFPEFLQDELKPVLWQARSTHHGPLISDVIDIASFPLSLKWTALQEDDQSYDSFLKINYATDWQTFNESLEHYVAPALNFVFADVSGNIGYTAAGLVPIRKQGYGRLPSHGWTSAYEWGGYIPRNSLPSSFNPDAGYVVTANNKIHSLDYPYFISHDWAPPYRANRIEERLLEESLSEDRVSFDEVVALQGDVKNLQAASLLQFLLQTPPRNKQQETALAYLGNWDAHMHEDSVAASIYQSWFRHFNLLLVEDELFGDLLNQDRSQFLESVVNRLNPIFLEQVVNGKKKHWCDNVRTAENESCEQMASSALSLALEELQRLVGNNMKAWKWGKIHRTYYPHSFLSDVPVIGGLFDREISNQGGSYSVNVAKSLFFADKGYRQFTQASYRQIIDLESLDRSEYVISTGQSGNWLSKHYDDLLNIHYQIDLISMAHSEERTPSLELVLEPKGPQSR